MALTLYYHPFSSYSWKVLIPLYEAATPFTARTIEDPQAAAELKRNWPIGRFPVLVVEQGGLTLPEASIIIEYLDSHHPGPQPLLPADADLRLEVRLLDRFFDNYLHASMQKIVADRLRAAERRDSEGVEKAHAMLDTCYDWLDTRMVDRKWAVGEAFTLADLNVAATLVEPWENGRIDGDLDPADHGLPALADWLARCVSRPSWAKVRALA